MPPCLEPVYSTSSNLVALTGLRVRPPPVAPASTRSRSENSSVDYDYYRQRDKWLKYDIDERRDVAIYREDVP